MYPRLFSAVKLGFLSLILITSSLVLSGCSLLDSKVKAGLQVITVQSASLFLDGQYLDKSPYINKKIKPGTYNLRIVPEDDKLAAYETPVTLHKGTLTVVNWNLGASAETANGTILELEPSPNGKTEVSFLSVPDSAIIRFDNREQAFSPILFSDVEPGTHEFESSLPSYDPQQHTVNVVKGYKLVVTVKLSKIPGTDLPVIETESEEMDATDSASNSATVSARIKKAVQASQSGIASGSAAPAGVTTGPRVVIQSTNYFTDGQETLRVRAEPKSSGAELGFATVGTGYSYQGEFTNGWYKILFNGQSGWVNSAYAKLIE
ncbi:MAG: hypothetical protein UW75_C0053G0002 [Parcubacteria group bacterium GW2011_GWF2_44_8]|nr:MAG: hypothetical protein UW75_C0053G0002 [Parcubacteria group bacterium GW2011_GWF2_44_8]